MQLWKRESTWGFSLPYRRMTNQRQLANLPQRPAPIQPCLVSNYTGIMFMEIDFSARILKHLAAMGVITETGPDEYRRTGFSMSMMCNRYSDSYPCM